MAPCNGGTAGDGLKLLACKGLLATPKKIVETVGASCHCSARLHRGPSAFQQTLVIMRHSERRDHVDETYRQSQEGLQWPEDAPLTSTGVLQAREVATEFTELHKQACFMAVATSPYRRCMETASEIAKHLSLPILIDQELGEVRDSFMPSDTISHRSPKQLLAMTKEMGIKVMNPRSRGGLEMFGKEPPWPETLEGAKRRFVVRIENYIRQSAEMQRNMILVTHADALAGALVMFEREGVNVKRIDFCGHLIARRTVSLLRQSQGVYADQWSVECHSVDAELLHVEALAKYHEQLYLETCEQTAELCDLRGNQRTRRDDLFDRTMKRLSSANSSIEEVYGFSSEGSMASSGPQSKSTDTGLQEQLPLDACASSSPPHSRLTDVPHHSEPRRAWRVGTTSCLDAFFKQLPWCWSPVTRCLRVPLQCQLSG